MYRCLQTKTFQTSSKQICQWILMWKDSSWWTFPWRKNYYWFWTHILSRNDGLNLKCFNDGCVCKKKKKKMFTPQYINWCTGVMWITTVMDSHSDGTHSLQRIHWWLSDVLLNFSKHVLMTKQNPLYLDRPEGDFHYLHFFIQDW